MRRRVPVGQPASEAGFFKMPRPKKRCSRIKLAESRGKSPLFPVCSLLSAGMAGLCASRPGKAWPGATVSLGSLLRGCAAFLGRRGLAPAPPQLLKKLAKLLRRFAVFAFIIAPKLSFKSTWKKPPHWDGSNQNLERSLIRFARFAAAPAIPGRREARSPCAPRTRTRCGDSRPDRRGCRGRGRTRWRRAYSG